MKWFVAPGMAAVLLAETAAAQSTKSKRVGTNDSAEGDANAAELRSDVSIPRLPSVFRKKLRASSGVVLH